MNEKMSQELNLSLLKGLEQEIILDVLYRDQILRKTDEERVRKLKVQLQQLRWEGSKSSSHEYPARSCARCQKALGVLMNRGAVCNGCSHRICSRCRIIINPYVWKCTVCYAHDDIQAKAGEWFIEARAKKFPTEDRHETAGTKLLKSYQKLSNISVVPPTPPPFSENTTGINTVEQDQKKSFHRSVENLFLSFTTHVRNISKSQNDMVVEKCLLTADYGQEMELRKEKRSQSDTAIDIGARIKQAPSLQRLISGAEVDGGIAPERDSVQKVTSSSPLSGIFSAGIKRGSLYSINSTCSEAGNYEEVDVHGEIEFAIRYIFNTSILEICIKACKNLAYGEEKKKKCNPYVKTYLLPDKSPQSKRKSSVKKNTVDPAFHETLKMGLIASYSLWAVSRSFELFLFSRVLGGISKGNVSLSTAIIADLTCPRARSKGMAMIGVAFSLGFTLGPMLGAYLAMDTEKGEIFYLWSALFAVMFAVTDLVFIFFLLPETLPKEKRVPSVMSGFQSVTGLLSPWALFQFSAVSHRMDPPSKQNLRILGLVYFLYLFLFSGLEYTLSFLVHQHFQFSSMQQGKMFFFIGITMALIQGGYTRQIKPGNELKTVKRAILLSIPAFLLIGWSRGMIHLSAGLLLYSFAAAAVVPCLSTVVSGYGPASQKGAVMGILRSLGALSRALGPILSAAVYWLAGAEVCFTACAFLFLIPLLLLGRIQEQTKED